MKHNKKRNVGIIYEQLSQAFSEALVDKNQTKATLIKKIIDEHYGKEGEIFKEFKIFNALLKVHASSDSLATNILKEGKNATNSLNRKKIEIEKSLLIKDINYTLNEKDFYSRSIPDYRNLATVQSLMNLWQQKPKSNFKILVEYENKVHALLREEKLKNNIQNEFDSDVDSLVVKIMREKFHKKYKPILSVRQSKIIESYTYGELDKTAQLLKEVKNEVVHKIKLFEKRCDNDILLENGYSSLFNFMKLKEFMQSITPEENQTN